VGNAKNTIALNGKIYDVTNGQPVNSSKYTSLPKQPAAPKNKLKVAPKNQTIDGVINSGTKFKPSLKRLKSHKNHQAAKHVGRHKPQHSKTLMRSGVKPAKDSATLHSKKTPAVISQADSQRQERSASVAKSSLVSRFSHVSLGQVIKKTEPLEVKKPQPPAPKNLANNTPAISQEAKAEAAPSSSSAKMFSKALEQATSHKQPPVKSSVKRPSIFKRLGLASRASKIIVIIIVIVGVLGAGIWYFLPNIEVRVASERAGFTATLPSYEPAGFSQSSVNYAQGQVTVAYKSNSDSSRNYTIQQTASNWDSEALLDGYITSQPSRLASLQTYQDQDGKTIYLFNGSDATWVNGGVWYNIQGNSDLSSDQLLKIADSFS
jgi:hypothetical protein